MTRQEFETILDRIYPSNQVLRESADTSLPERMKYAAVHCFTYPEGIPTEHISALREQMRVLDEHGVVGLH